MMDMNEILELERKNNEQRLEASIKQAHFENKQMVLNAGIDIITRQMAANTLAVLYGALK